MDDGGATAGRGPWRTGKTMNHTITAVITSLPAEGIVAAVGGMTGAALALGPRPPALPLPPAPRPRLPAIIPSHPRQSIALLVPPSIV